MVRQNNLLVGQSGGPTAVINCSLQGIIEEARKQESIGGVYGMRRGIEGLLSSDLVDLRHERPATIHGLGRTPAAALGSCRRQLDDDDLQRALTMLHTYGIRYLLYIGGNDSADTSHRLAAAAQQAGMALTVVGVPKTIDNDLPEMDHTPGYPSIARYVAMATQDAGMDAQATASVDQVVILEVMGRNSGWVAAASALARRQPGQAPHLIYTPERPLSASRFLDHVQCTYREFGFVVAVVTETVRDEAGQPWAQAPEKDGFGHPRLVGAASRLCRLVRQELGLRARFNTPGTLQRSSTVCASPVDRAEAFAAGVAAVQAAVAGHNDQMVTIQRLSDRPYRSFTGLTPLDRIANHERHLPDSFINASGNFVTDVFLRYARPLIGGRLPAYVTLRGQPVVLEQSG